MEMNKKGIMDIILIAGILFALVVSAIIVTAVFDELDPGIQESIGSSSRANDSWMDVKAVTENFDMAVLAGFICLVIISLILAVVIPANPVFIPVYIVLGLFVLVIAVAISNGYDMMSDSSQLSGIVNDHYPVSDFIMTNLPLLMGILVVIMMIITYAKPNQ